MLWSFFGEDEFLQVTNPIFFRFTRGATPKRQEYALPEIGQNKPRSSFF